MSKLSILCSTKNSSEPHTVLISASEVSLLSFLVLDTRNEFDIEMLQVYITLLCTTLHTWLIFTWITSTSTNTPAPLKPPYPMHTHVQCLPLNQYCCEGMTHELLIQKDWTRLAGCTTSILTNETWLISHINWEKLQFLKLKCSLWGIGILRF